MNDDKPSAPAFESLGIPADIGIICSETISEFVNELVKELEATGLSAFVMNDDQSEVKALTRLVLVSPEFKPRKAEVMENCLLVLLDGEPFSEDYGVPYAFARLTTAKKLKDAECLARNVRRVCK